MQASKSGKMRSSMPNLINHIVVDNDKLGIYEFDYEAPVIEELTVRFKKRVTGHINQASCGVVFLNVDI